MVCGGEECTHVLYALPTKAVARVDLCNIKQIEWDMRCGCGAWLMLVQPTSHMVTMEADTGQGSNFEAETACLNNLVTEFANVFEPPGMPPECKTVHRIKLEQVKVQNYST